MSDKRSTGREVPREPVTRREAWGIAVVLAVALLVNLLLATKTFLGPDAPSYDRFAQDAQDWSYWLDPEAFEANHFPMGYPSLLALSMRLTGGSAWLYQALSIAMALALVTLAWSLVQELPRRIRMTTMVAVAASPALLWMAQNNGYEMLIAFLMTTALVLTRRAARGGVGIKGLAMYWAPVMAGACMGLALLAQFKTVIVIPVLAYLMWQQGRGRAVAFLAATAVLPLAWSIRNFAVMGMWSPFSRNGEVGFWVGNNPYTVTGGAVIEMPPAPGFSSLYEAGLNFIVSQPEAAWALFLRRFVRLLEPTYVYRDFTSLPIVDLLPHYYAIAFSAVGILLFATYAFGRLWAGVPTLPPVGALSVFVLAFLLVHLPFLSEPRYLAPIVPIAIAVSVPTGFALWGRWRNTGRAG